MPVSESVRRSAPVPGGVRPLNAPKAGTGALGNSSAPPPVGHGPGAPEKAQDGCAKPAPRPACKDSPGTKGHEGGGANDKSKLLELLKSLLESLNAKAAVVTIGSKIRAVLELSHCFEPELATKGQRLLDRIESGEQISYDSIKAWVFDVQKTQETKSGFFGKIVGALRKK